MNANWPEMRKVLVVRNCMRQQDTVATPDMKNDESPDPKLSFEPVHVGDLTLTDELVVASKPSSDHGEPVGNRTAWLGVCAAAVSIFLFVADSGLMAIALPEIERAFPTAPRSTIAWVASSFVIAQASMLLIAGQLGDRRGRKRFYLFGLLLFVLGALTVTFSNDLRLMIGARIVQGFGAAFLTSGALPLVLPLFPRSKAPRVIGVWGAIGSIAAWLAPTAGGLLVEHSWRYAFAAVVPFGIGGFLLGWKVLKEDTHHERRGTSLDRIGILLGPPGFGLAMLVLSQGRRWGWGSSTTLRFGALSMLLIAAFVFQCRRAETVEGPAPLLDLTLFTNREFSANVVGGILQQIGFFSWFLTAPLIMTQLWGWSTTQAGFALALSQVLATVGSPTAGFLVETVGPYTVLVFGAVINAVGSLWLVMTAKAEVRLWTGYVPAALLLGLGASWCGTVTSGSGLAALRRSELGIGNSAQQLLRRVGGSIGVALALGLLGNAKGSALLPGARRVWWLGVVVHLAMVVPLLMVPDPFASRRRSRKRKQA
jgi:EmrB/QacA subfamily drug resistance transporter